MRSHKDEPKWMTLWVRPLGVGTLAGALICFVALLLMAALLLTQDAPQSGVAPLALVSLVIGALVGGITAARLAGQNGWLMGLCTGGVLFLLLLLAGGFAMLRDMQSAHMWVKLAITLGSAAVGGIVGVALPKKRR